MILFHCCFLGNQQVERGCTLDVDVDPNQKEDYKRCSETGCNKHNVRFNWCLRCHGGKHSNCSAVKTPDDFYQYCDQSFYPYEKRGCFTRQFGTSLKLYRIGETGINFIFIQMA